MEPEVYAGLCFDIWKYHSATLPSLLAGCLRPIGQLGSPFLKCGGGPGGALDPHPSRASVPRRTRAWAWSNGLTSLSRAV